MFSAPIEFDRQDEGHLAYGPLTWEIITKHYNKGNVIPYKRYGNKQVLTGLFAGAQYNNKDLAKTHFEKLLTKTSNTNGFGCKKCNSKIILNITINYL
jgi:hypothetical protein